MLRSLSSVACIDQLLTEPTGPFVHVLGLVNPVPLPTYNWPVNDSPEIVVRRCNVRRCSDTTSFMNELAAALQFPDHFGGNGAALRDCLSDLCWLEPARHFVILVRHAGGFLCNESAASRRAIIGLLEEEASTLQDPDIAGWPGGSMPKRTMHWLFLCDPEGDAQLAEELGAELLKVASDSSR